MAGGFAWTVAPEAQLIPNVEKYGARGPGRGAGCGDLLGTTDPG